MSVTVIDFETLQQRLQKHHLNVPGKDYERVSKGLKGE